MPKELDINSTVVEPTLAHASIAAERCIAELQRGRAIVLTNAADNPPEAGTSYQVVQLVETLKVEDIETLITTHDCQLILNRSRALAIELMVDSNAVCLKLPHNTPAETIRRWAGLRPDVARSQKIHSPLASSRDSNEHGESTELSDLIRFTNSEQAKAALNLATHAHALPAFIMYSSADKPADLLSVSTPAASLFSDQSGKLIKLSTARIPLATAESVELTVFRERHGNAEHVAITVGTPDVTKPVTVRLHSSCFTGDILGSMKCDCGEQLQGAISSMAADKGGVVLYVSQEGRGIGLASKLLAYQLQDQGLDTIDANQHLGFDADDRRYLAAVFMLEQLGIKAINLMTNNPLKIKALREHGVTVHGRVPSPATVNAHNARYLKTKRERAGHFASCETSG